MDRCLEAVGLEERVDWQYISSEVGTRDPRQCFDRYVYQKKQKKTAEKHIWSESENQVFQKASALYGTDWKRIQREFFPAFTIGQLVNKHGVLQKQQKRRRLKKGEEMVRELHQILQHRKNE